MKPPDFSKHREAIEALCREFGVRRLSVFGSALTPEFGPESDIDLLVEFVPGARLGFKFFELEYRLSDLLSRQVDLNTPACLSEPIRKRVLATAKVQYEAAA